MVKSVHITLFVLIAIPLLIVGQPAYIFATVVNPVDNSQSSDTCEIQNISADDQTKCPKIEVRAKKIPQLRGLPVYHLFIIHTDQDGKQYIYRGGPTRDNPPWGAIQTCYGPYEASGRCDDWVSNAPSVTVLEGEDVNKLVLNCLQLEIERIQAKKVPYHLFGPNSNSVAYTLLDNCDIPAEKPVNIAPGWGERI
jgi:hypothetical protein